MRLNTPTLFLLLLKTMPLDLICDVGSNNGYHSLLFRKTLPFARIIAFEANPRNADMMLADIELQNHNIEVQHKAVSNHNGTTNFHVVPLSTTEDLSGRSSIRAKRNQKNVGSHQEPVKTVRLDTFISYLQPTPSSIALWVDVEGSAYEVLEAIEKVRETIKIVHVEVETQEMWQGQKLKTDVIALMQSMGFHLLARGFDEIQHDLVFINKAEYVKSPLRFKGVVFFSFILTYLRRFAGKTVYSSLSKLFLSMSRKTSRKA